MVLLALLACSSSSTPTVTPVPGKRPDVVIVTLDTTRADRLGAYGYAKARTETIDELARNGIRFSQAISPLPLTIPSHATMFTGLFPYHHGIRSNGDSVLRADLTTLAERFQQAGWATGASTSAFVTTRQWGFSQGFDAYYDELPDRTEQGDKNFWHTERPGDQVVNDALGWVASQSADKPRFLWVHLYDAHYPYVARAPYDKDMDPYDAEIAFLDDQVARLREAFAGRDVVWALIGDHGESLGEHHENTHGLWAYQATAHIPFILSGTGITPGVVTAPVSSADLTPTLLHAAGLPVPEGLDGKVQPGSVQVPYAESWQLAERFNLAPHRAIVDGNLKLIATPKPELYDVVADPGETTNLAAARPDDVKRLQAKLAALGAAPPGKGDAAIDADTLSQLAQLGYMGGGGEVVADPGSYPDPKDHVPFLQKLQEIEEAGRAKTPEEALAALDAAFVLKPDSFEIRMRRIQLLSRVRRTEEARDLLEDTTRMFPDRARVWSMTAVAALQEGRYEDAVVAARRVIEIDPADVSGPESLVEALFRTGRTEEALRQAEGLLVANPRAFGVAALLGQHWMRQQDFIKAETYLRKALEAPAPRRGARVQLAMLATAAGAQDDAITLLQAELRDFPGNLAARRMLARRFGDQQRWSEQVGVLGGLARALPDDAGLQRELAQAFFNLGKYLEARQALERGLLVAPDDADILLLHANLLAKEGKREEGLQVLARANAANEARVKAAGAAAGGKKAPGKAPGKKP